MTEAIALLGWGSLLWEGGSAFDAWHKPWLNEGPVLKLEFSRISRSRHDALTLVIDPTNGVPTTVAYCMSRRLDIAETIEDLRIRECTSAKNIGFIHRGGKAKFRDPTSHDTILAWAAAHDMDGVVWTDLPSNFEKIVGRPFSVAAAVNYVQTLDPEGKAKALEYIRQAPEFVQTPLRNAFSHQP